MVVAVQCVGRVTERAGDVEHRAVAGHPRDGELAAGDAPAGVGADERVGVVAAERAPPRLVGGVAEALQPLGAEPVLGVHGADARRRVGVTRT